MSILSRLGRTVVAAAAVANVAGCAAVLDPNGTKETAGSVVNQVNADKAMAAVMRGDYVSAERNAKAALRFNPMEPSALLAAGLASQGSGRYDLARQYYEVIISNRLAGTIMTPGETGVMTPRSIVEVAQANMAAIDKITGRSHSRTAAESGRPPGASAVGAPPFPMNEPVLGASGRPQVNSLVEPVPHAGRVSEAEANVAGRFRILKRLLDEGLATPQEYAQRRAVNIGALLPFTQSPPAQGLERPIPGDEAVVTRLRDLGRTLEARGITPDQLAAERGAILEALLPEKPRKVETPPLPPKDLIEAGQAVGRLERLKAAGLITAEEARKEKDAIDRALDRHLANQQVAGTATGLRPGAPGSAGPMGAPPPSAHSGRWGVSLAWGSSEEKARAAWDRIKAKFPVELAGFESSIKLVKRKGKPDSWQVVAGPVADKNAARKLCKTLSLHRQACDPANM